ncbi:DUF1653 domain-containing protein [Thalassotalea euphylliae]|uniref:DUF1653 domain-containing protein n=1 Tax=Thalassotalea euphylliae TaxID=1655234 RepID=A0A3E0UFF2_9GAMM|nr:DUF1653 domain-containing protein [Thalassotalea euphylliae]REL35596.1 DUF1653 domain-containing protein [Thalassotalea euphylliae]
MIPLGTYQHFKGNKYQVTQVARHSETEEWMVVYYPLYGTIEQTGNPEFWVRPLAMFDETIERGGKTLKRFSFMQDE